MKTWRTPVILSAVLVTVLWLATSATAQFGPCRDDVSKFCKDVQRGGGRILACLSEHEADLSEACKAHVAEMKKKGRPMGGSEKGASRRAKRQAILAACKTDMDKLCKEANRGGGRVVQCLRSHEAELSPECSAALKK